MEEQICGQCRYFIQHYGLSREGVLYKINCGHCIKGRPKTKKPDRKGCEDFTMQEEKTKYVTKEYLTVSLLRRVLEMELLPENLEG